MYGEPAAGLPSVATDVASLRSTSVVESVVGCCVWIASPAITRVNG